MKSIKTSSSLIRYQSHLKFNSLPISSLQALNEDIENQSSLDRPLDVFDVLDSDSPEVAMSKNTFLRRVIGKYIDVPIDDFADIRYNYRLIRRVERSSGYNSLFPSTQLTFYLHQSKMKMKQYFERNGIISKLNS